MMGYTTRDVSSLLGLTPRQVQELGRSGILDPGRDAANRYLFTFQDLVLLRTARELLDARVPQRRILRSLRRLKDQLPEGGSLAAVRIAAEGDEVVVHEEDRAWEADTGQLRFVFDVAELAEQVQPLVTRSIDDAVARPGTSTREWLELGVELEGHAPAQARRAYEKALELDPQHADALINLGRLLHVDGEIERAAGLYGRALEASGGDHATAAFNLGIAMEDLERDREAQWAYRAAISADPGFADAHYNLSRVLERAGDRVSALRHLKQYRSLTTGRA